MKPVPTDVAKPDADTRLLCEAPGGCPHTAAWLTDAGFFYCQGHQYLGDAEATLAQAVKAASC